MAVVERLPSTGCRPTQRPAPRRLCPGAVGRWAGDGRARAGARSRRRLRRRDRSAPRGCARAGRRSTSTGSGSSWRAWARWPALFRRGDALLAEPVPDVSRALSRLRIEGSVLDGSRPGRHSAGARRRPADPGRPSASSGHGPARRGPVPHAHRQGDRAPAGAVARCRRQPARHRQSRARGGAAGSAAGAAAAAPPAGLAAPRARLHRGSGRRLGDRSRRALRHPGPPRLAEPSRRHRPRRVRQRRHALRRAHRGDRAGQRAPRGRGGGGAGDAAGAPRADRAAPARAAALRGAVEMCVAVDDLVARARYAVAAEGEVPEVVAAPAGARGRATAGIRCCWPVRSRWCRSTWRWIRTSAPCSSAAPTPAARPCCSRRSGSPRRWRRAASCRRSGAGSRLPAVRRLLRRHRRPAVDRRQPLHLQRARRDAPPRAGGGRRRHAGAARRGGKRHRSRRRRRARRGDPGLAHRARRAHARDHAPGRAQGPGQPHAGRGERLAAVRRRDAHAHLPLREGGAGPLLRPGDRPAAGRDRPRCWPTPRRGCPTRSATSTRCSPRSRSGRARCARPRPCWTQREVELTSLGARLEAQEETQARARGRAQATGKGGRAGRAPSGQAVPAWRRARLVEEALGAARVAGEDAAAREARRMVEEGIREQGSSWRGGARGGVRPAAGVVPARGQAAGCGCRAAAPARCSKCARTARRWSRWGR